MKKMLSHKLESLLQNSSFDQLSDVDKAYVLTHINVKEYEAYHYILSQTNNLSSSAPMKAPGFIKSQILSSVSNELSDPKGWYAKGIPLWLVLGLLSLIGIGIMLYNPEPIIQTKVVEKELIMTADPIYIYQTDTIYQEILAEPVVITKEVIKTVYKDRPSVITGTPIATNTDTKRLSDPNGLNPLGITSELKKEEDVSSGVVGRSVADDAALMELLGGIN